MTPGISPEEERFGSQAVEGYVGRRMEIQYVNTMHGATERSYSRHEHWYEQYPFPFAEQRHFRPL